ncbi:MAG: hypothetical protein JW818_19325 [Pirellulales bacterium]|nr:hypothetical protein [Pirellulales bacterium]
MTLVQRLVRCIGVVETSLLDLEQSPVRAKIKHKMIRLVHQVTAAAVTPIVIGRRTPLSDNIFGAVASFNSRDQPARESVLLWTYRVYSYGHPDDLLIADVHPIGFWGVRENAAIHVVSQEQLMITHKAYKVRV